MVIGFFSDTINQSSFFLASIIFFGCKAGILLWHFLGLESPGKKTIGPGKALNSNSKEN